VEVPTPEGRRLSPRYRIEPFAECDAVDEEAVIAMWVREGALEEARARERVRQVELVAVEREEGVVGVATTMLFDVVRLGMPMWRYRTFVARAHRESDIAFLLLHATRDRLRERFVSGEDRRGAGVIFDVQNETLKRVRNQAVWKTSRFAFIGEDERGAHHRVYYFPGATVPGPPE
jgi:hypothetical protein